MGKLRVITDGVEAAEFELRPGEHRVGRMEDNDWCVPHASVSSHHCLISVDDGEVRIKDLGSTNGTFLDGEQIGEALLAPGCALRLGEVNVAYEAPQGLSLARGGIGIKQKESEPPPMETAARPAIEDRFTPQLRAPLASTAEMPPSFFASLPGAFKYPVTGGAWLLLVIGTVFFGLIDAFKFVSSFAGPFGGAAVGFLSVFGTGYLYSYIQRIITATAGGERRLPEWPDFTEFWSDIIVPAFQFTVTMIICFVPAVAWLIFAPEQLKLAAIPVALLGLVYLPMGFLAVAMLDTVFALNPLLVIPSILKVPLAYLTACGMLLVIFAVQFGTELLAEVVLQIPIVPALIGGSISFYFICVMARVLGLLYYYNREELGWV